jgi:cytochrome c oxidase subunit 4
MSTHVASRGSYLLVFGALLVLTALTTGVAYLELGRWNDVVALGIAGVKALLVAYFFMHLRFSGRLVWIYAIGALFWLAVLIGLTLGDYATRPEVTGW